MNFITFPVGSTNIFPAANGVNGSQLLTEWNLKSRESVDTYSEIQYDVGHSFVHSMSDFSVSIMQASTGVPLNDYTLCVSSGKGIINGHMVECLTDMVIDLVEANAKLQRDSLPRLKGELAIGIRAFYATEETIAGTLLVENEDEMYVGIQLVVLPRNEMITPEESPGDPSKVTAHLRLATFIFNNNKITSIKNLSSKIAYIKAERIENVDDIVSDKFITKTGLNSKKLYSFAGKGTDPETGLDTWEDVTDSTMVWDANPERTSIKPSYTQSQFVTSANSVYLCAVHKQVEGMVDDEGNPEYYASRLLTVPVADYSANTPGVVNKAYTSRIKDLSDKVNEFRTSLSGKQIYYMETKDETDSLPPINKAWDCGDYVLVGQDYTIENTSDGVRSPSTMYVVLPGVVTSILYSTTVTDSDEIPATFTGAELGYIEWSAADRYPEPNTTNPDEYPEFYSDEDSIRGIPNVDYFRLKYYYTDESSVSHFKNYYYVVSTSEKRVYSDAVYVTGEIPLATESAIGGFLNVSTDLTDYGYVYRDDYGRLRLTDYALLRSGVLAYQLGENVTLPTGSTTEDTQAYLTEYVNNRVAFPNANQLLTTNPNCIDVYFTLYEEDEKTVLTIENIDSRFNASVCLHILGEATKTTIINIVDCEKIRIDNAIEGSPVINVYRSGLYYDPHVFNYIRSCDRGLDETSTFTGMEDITLWYEPFDETDPNLTVNDMTIRELDAPIIPEQTSYWTEVGSASNDNYYLTALASLTFAGNGDVIGCGLLIANNSTDNVDPGEKIVVGDFELPQGSGLTYPKTCMTRQLKVTGTFTSAYYSDEVWYVTDTSFSALTSKYDQYDATTTTKGNIAFHSKTSLVESGITQTSIPVWETDTYHLFFGGVIS